MTASDRVAFVFGGFGLFIGEIDIFKERTSAGFFARVGEFVGADGANDVADALGGKISEMMVGNVFFDGIIERARHLAGLER